MAAGLELAGPRVATILALRVRRMALSSSGGPQAAFPAPDASTSTARKSLTLVSVGPVTTWSPSAWKKPWPSLSASRAGGDSGRVIHRPVRDQQGEEDGRVGGGGEAPTLDGREVLAHAVHLADVRA